MQPVVGNLYTSLLCQTAEFQHVIGVNGFTDVLGTSTRSCFFSKVKSVSSPQMDMGWFHSRVGLGRNFGK